MTGMYCVLALLAGCKCKCVCRYDVKVLKDDSHSLVNSGVSNSLVVGTAAVITIIIEANDTNVSVSSINKH